MTDVKSVEFKGKATKITYVNDLAEIISVETQTVPHPEFLVKAFNLKDIVETINKGAIEFHLNKISLKDSNEVSVVMKDDKHSLTLGFTVLDHEQKETYLLPFLKEVEDFLSGAKLAQQKFEFEAEPRFTGKALPPLTAITLVDNDQR